ncbi:hypothetical protein PNO24_07620 [Gemella haemolysans]|uniref:hypothetical protein n=1 Tax=Gemella haemolysans TaxID=1379 RepID=UPI00232BADC8|nr:hypothetical protein [Gemella haemolysans]MDB6213776.1 hypothetical protein [Gemella haemolysans]
MKYFLKETYVKANHAGPKARMDAEAIMVDVGFKEYYLSESRKNNVLNKDDIIVLQFPLLWKSLKKQIRMRFLKKKNFKAYLLIHDIESLRNNKIRTFSDFKHSIIHFLQNKTVLERVDGIIAHNNKMKFELVKMGINPEKIVTLEIFDYLIPDFNRNKTYAKDKILLAGNFDIRKTKYARNLPEKPEFEIYGINFEHDNLPNNVHYKGAFSPDELPNHLQGGFGLVWDGDSSDTCSGMYGEYLKINNPHKASLYLASNFPIIVWRQSALADFVKKYNCGIIIDSLYEIAGVLESMNEEKYQQLIDNCKIIGEKIRQGDYLKKSLEECERKL